MVFVIIAMNKVFFLLISSSVSIRVEHFLFMWNTIELFVHDVRSSGIFVSGEKKINLFKSVCISIMDYVLLTSMHKFCVCKHISINSRESVSSWIRRSLRRVCVNGLMRYIGRWSECRSKRLFSRSFSFVWGLRLHRSIVWG